MLDKILNIKSTRFSNVSSTIRASIYKQGERNLIKNLVNGNGYEGVVEIYEKSNSFGSH